MYHLQITFNKNNKMFKKKIVLFLTFLILGILVIGLTKKYETKVVGFATEYVEPYTPLIIKYYLKNIYHGIYLKRLRNDYNTLFLPKTQFADINFTKIKLSFLLKENNGIYDKDSERKSFHIELIDNNKAWIIDNEAKIYEINLENILSNKKEKIQYKIIESNIKPYQVLDTLIHDKVVYLSFTTLKDKCYKFNIYKAPITKKNLTFESFFTSNECNKKNPLGGKIQHYIHKNNKGLLFTVGDGHNGDEHNKNKYNYAQDLKSIFGKILFKDFKDNKNYSIFSSGHRNPQGLYVDNDLILSTEHGPKGGDEINNIIFEKNYGWPIASYGDDYVDERKLKYSKDHSSYNFKEPVFSFIPSIGISELIKIPDDLSPFWQDNFILSSLYGHALYRIKFGKKFDKIIYYEKIYIGERIRDLKYSKKFKTIFLALESEGNLGVFNLKN
jgi:hypothetical protein